MKPESKLKWVKIAHTIIWAFFADCILAIPIFTFMRRLDVSATLIAIVSAEVAVLALNRMRCPLTDVASRYTTERAANFDIFLPHWLAEYNKLIFGALYTTGALYTLIVWRILR